MTFNGEKKTIYSSAALASAKELSGAPLGSYYKDSRVNLLTKDIASGFNTYRNWKEFDLALPGTFEDDGVTIAPYSDVARAVKSLFNPAAAVYGNTDIRKYLNLPLLDNPESRQLMRDRTRCSIKDLVTLSETGALGREIYNYSDFMYCKHLGKIPNNYLITLRKFPMPCGDHINKYSDDDQNAHMPDIGRMVTWIGTPGNELSTLLTYSYSLEVKELKAPVLDSPNGTAGQSGGQGMAGFIGLLDGTYAQELKKTGGQGYNGEQNAFAGMLAGTKNTSYGDGFERYVELQDKNRVLQSFQNKIMSVRAPGADENSAKGLPYMPDIKLQFDYELRSYDGINAKAAMLDLIANILMVTYIQGEFFPGSYKTTKMATSNIYANLPIFKNGTNSVGDLFSNMFNSVTQASQQLFGWKSGASASENFANFRKSLQSMSSNLFSVIANGLINKLGRPQQYALTSLISPTPTGQWHLTIGNPRNPIWSIGNLLLTEASITHTGPLGLDDFPTGLTVNVTLQHAKPRDSVAIEQMYMQGDNRIYMPVGDDQVRYMYESAKEYKGSSNTVDNAQGDGRQEKTDTSSPKNEKIYLKYFGTADIQSIKLAAGEAFTGSQKKSTAKDKK